MINNGKLNVGLLYQDKRFKAMIKIPCFISFDFDHDADLRTLLVGQAKHSDSPFSIADWSLKEAIDNDWKAKIRTRIKKTKLVIVLCGEYTHSASGVDVELNIAKEENVPYFLLSGRKGKSCSKPKAAKTSDKLYKWEWDNLKKLIHGGR